MIDYKVENGKISTIDGYKVGGDELTGQKLFDTTADSASIIRAVKSNGKLNLNLHVYIEYGGNNQNPWKTTNVSHIVENGIIPQFAQFDISLRSIMWGGDIKGFASQQCELNSYPSDIVGLRVGNGDKIYKALFHPYCYLSGSGDSAEWFLKVITLEPVDVSGIDTRIARLVPAHKSGTSVYDERYRITYIYYE